MFNAGTEVGRSKCSIGRISSVNVMAAARQCGLATLFTILCLIDHDMNGPKGNVFPPFDEENVALKSLVLHKNKLAWVKQRCSSLWDLWFLADPKSGGYAYFSGAIASGFSMMLIDDENNKIHGPEKTEVWKSQFDPNTG